MAAIWGARAEALVVTGTLRVTCAEGAGRCGLETAALTGGEAVCRACLDLAEAFEYGSAGLRFVWAVGALGIQETEEVIRNAEEEAFGAAVDGIHADERTAFLYDEGTRRAGIERDGIVGAAAAHLDTAAAVGAARITAAYSAWTQTVLADDEAARRAYAATAQQHWAERCQIEKAALDASAQTWGEWAASGTCDELRPRLLAGEEAARRKSTVRECAAESFGLTLEAAALHGAAEIWVAWEETFGAGLAELRALCSAELQQLVESEAEGRRVLAAAAAVLLDVHVGYRALAHEEVLARETLCLHEACARLGADDVGAVLPYLPEPPTDAAQEEATGAARAASLIRGAPALGTAAEADEAASSIGNAFMRKSEQSSGGAVEELLANLEGITVHHLRRGVELVWWQHGMRSTLPVTPLNYFLVWLVAAPLAAVAQVLGVGEGVLRGGTLSIQDEVLIALGGEEVVCAAAGKAADDLYPPGASRLLLVWKWAGVACSILAAQKLLLDASAFTWCAVPAALATAGTWVRPVLCPRADPATAAADGTTAVLLPAFPVHGCALVAGGFDVPGAPAAPQNPRAPNFDTAVATAQTAEWRLAPSWREARQRVRARGRVDLPASTNDDLLVGLDVRAAWFATGSRLQHLIASEAVLRFAIQKHRDGAELSCASAAALAEAAAPAERPSRSPIVSLAPPVSRCTGEQSKGASAISASDMLMNIEGKSCTSGHAADSASPLAALSGHKNRDLKAAPVGDAADPFDGQAPPTRTIPSVEGAAPRVSIVAAGTKATGPLAPIQAGTAAAPARSARSSSAAVPSFGVSTATASEEPAFSAGTDASPDLDLPRPGTAELDERAFQTLSAGTVASERGRTSKTTDGVAFEILSGGTSATSGTPGDSTGDSTGRSSSTLSSTTESDSEASTTGDGDEEAQCKGSDSRAVEDEAAKSKSCASTDDADRRDVAGVECSNPGEELIPLHTQQAQDAPAESPRSVVMTGRMTVHDDEDEDSSDDADNAGEYEPEDALPQKAPAECAGTPAPNKSAIGGPDSDDGSSEDADDAAEYEPELPPPHAPVESPRKAVVTGGMMAGDEDSSDDDLEGADGSSGDADDAADYNPDDSPPQPVCRKPDMRGGMTAGDEDGSSDDADNAGDYEPEASQLQNAPMESPRKPIVTGGMMGGDEDDASSSSGD
eukprot:TRINITY_DN4769_c0_g3_i1.p1 TRINITY_DN4769_c0_g3~~TRINITY_DN4769_c0_g3_i1.p1  ORF type:complete len:1332 (+),score=246.38 TRINITY_DN4769_c0_g3_i1:451-3996(+)